MNPLSAISRRSFLRSAAGALLVPAALVKPVRTYFLPPRGGWATPITFPAPSAAWGTIIGFGSVSLEIHGGHGAYEGAEVDLVQ
jgi:hypothetical protein